MHGNCACTDITGDEVAALRSVDIDMLGVTEVVVLYSTLFVKFGWIKEE